MQSFSRLEGSEALDQTVSSHETKLSRPALLLELARLHLHTRSMTQDHTKRRLAALDQLLISLLIN
jgi:hypothetical protein